MSEDTQPEVSLEDIGHPKGTLAVLVVYMLLFVFGFLGMFFFEFLPRGNPDANPSPPAVEHQHHGGTS
ncbi:MAG: hypothetical protein AAGD38_03390 [Acidobacteriota bacterium]